MDKKLTREQVVSLAVVELLRNSDYEDSWLKDLLKLEKGDVKITDDMLESMESSITAVLRELSGPFIKKLPENHRKNYR